MKRISPPIIFSLFSYSPCPNSRLVCLVFCLRQCICLLSGAVVRPALPPKEAALCFPRSDASVPSCLLPYTGTRIPLLCNKQGWGTDVAENLIQQKNGEGKDQFSSR